MTRAAPWPCTRREASAVKAIRRSSPCTNMASASMKLPMNRKMIGSANGANAVRTGATPRSTATIGPTSAVTGSGSASVTHSTIIATSVAASLCAARGRPDGHASTNAKASGATRSPTTWRRRLNSSSAGEYVSSVSTASSACVGRSGTSDIPVNRATDQFGRAGEIQPVVSPLDALDSSRRVDLHVAGRAAAGGRRDRSRAGAGARGFRWTDAALPDEDVDPTRLLHRREFDVRACGKTWVLREKRAVAMQVRFGQLVAGHQHDALRVAHAQRDDMARLGADQGDLVDLLGMSHRRAKRDGATRGFDAIQRLHAGIRFDEKPVLPRRSRGEQRGEAPDPVAGNLGVAAVGIEE